jgi:hypothetical protein
MIQKEIERKIENPVSSSRMKNIGRDNRAEKHKAGRV